VKEIVAVSTAIVAPAAVSLSEYLATIYRPDCEYVDGELLERNVGECDHSRVQALLSAYLLRREKQWSIVVAIEQRVQVKASRFRIPDILVMAGRPPDGQIVNTPPFLCIEILSPSDRVAEMQERIDDYLKFGVQYVWLIHPRTQRAFIYSPGRVEEVTDGVLRTHAPHISVPFSEIENG
jgi:Uma2 family endonuclease